MESSRSSKRQRLISVSSPSYVSPPRPDVPAIFESLNDDTLTTVLEFVGKKSYRSFGGLSKHCKEIYITSGMKKETFLFGYAPLSVIQDRIERATAYCDYCELYERVGKGVLLYNRRDVMDWALQRQNTYSLKGICNVAGEDGRLDLLEEVWDKLEDFDNKRKYIFYSVDDSAAFGGKLNVLKWLETKSTPISNYLCTNKAVRGGHLHILQWLKEEKGFELRGGLYNEAIWGDRLHILKWLREQACPWYESNFIEAAQKGNLDILQWLHDEGCPWDPRIRAYRCRLKPEVVQWLRVNGYGNRIHNND